MIFGFFDVEATSVDPEQASIIEWALLRYCSEEAQIVSMHTELVRLPENEAGLDEEITEITGISVSMLEDHGKARDLALRNIYALFDKCDYIVAHNGLGYDKPVLERELKTIYLPLPEKPWIDTMYDLPFQEGGTRKLSYLAADHGFLNPLSHRALSDCISLWKIFTQYDPEVAVVNANTPLIQIRADVSYATKDEAKKARYFWDAERKIWVKTIRQSSLEAEQILRPFKVLVL